MSKFLRWVDSKLFPLDSPKQMATDAVDQVTRDLLKAQDQLDYAYSQVLYKENQLARLLIQSGTKCPIILTTNQLGRHTNTGLV